MDSKIILESLLNTIDIGTVFESINNYRKRSWKVDLREIIKYMITGTGQEIRNAVRQMYATIASGIQVKVKGPQIMSSLPISKLSNPLCQCRPLSR